MDFRLSALTAGSQSQPLCRKTQSAQETLSSLVLRAESSSRTVLCVHVRLFLGEFRFTEQAHGTRQAALHSQGPYQGDDIQQEHEEGAELRDCGGWANALPRGGAPLLCSTEVPGEKTRASLSPMIISSVSLLFNKTTYSLSNIKKDSFYRSNHQVSVPTTS